MMGFSLFDASSLRGFLAALRATAFCMANRCIKSCRTAPGLSDALSKQRNCLCPCDGHGSDRGECDQVQRPDRSFRHRDRGWHALASAEPEQPGLKPTPTVLVAGAPVLPEVSAPPVTHKPRPKAEKAKTVVERFEDRFLLPDFLGLTVDEVRQITARIPLDVKISGLGRAVSQDPPAGTVVAQRGGSVRVRFEAPRVAQREGEI